MNSSYSFSTLVPTINEAESLRETVETLIGDEILEMDSTRRFSKSFS